MPDELALGPEPPDPETPPVPPELPAFPIAGIGASAGGLEAVTQLLANLPEKPGMALVLIQHMEAHRPSHLVEVLARSARMAVQEAADNLALEANRLYVIPPDTNLALKHGRFKHFPRGEARGAHLPIDFFLRSLAEEARERSIGIILSGTGSDGTFGLAEIKAAGGFTLAQDGQSAKYPSMPKSAADEGVVDFVLPPPEIARELVGMGKLAYLNGRDGEEGGKLPSWTEDEFHRILLILRSYSGVDFAHYRDTTIKRRIQRRMVVNKVDGAEAYVKLLKENRGEVQSLYQDVLINVTRFFRNNAVFEALKSSVFPEIHKQKAPGSSIRVWAAGCSTGEEAYSLAMALVEFQDTQPHRPLIRIFASDISETPTLEKARLGIYPDTIEADVSEERLRRFFTREGMGYKINQDIRDMCVFARHNVAGDPPFSRLDLITCRNVLIYLSPHLQRKVLSTFHYSLNPVGFLVLGTSETVGRDAELFNVVDPKNKIYSKKAAATRGQHFYMPEFAPKPAGALHSSGPSSSPLDYEKAADRILLRRFSPAGILVNRDLEILQFRGRTSPYLEPPQGDPSFKLVKMAAETLFLEIRGAIREAEQKGVTQYRPGVKVRDGRSIRDLNLEIIPVRPTESGESCFLVLFEEQDAEKAGAKPAAAQAAPDPSDADEVAYLRLELAAAREYLKTIREQYDTVNEELTSSNEEILSSNEELQSTNEELETAKEELQSTNEELTTLNEELRVRNIELSQANNDLNNLFTSIGVPIVMLGSDARIRRFTPAAAKSLRLNPADIGRNLNEINTGIDSPELDRDILQVIDTVAPINRDVRDRGGRWHSLRIHPYRTSDNKIDGAVVILLDVDKIKRAERDLMVFKFMCDEGPYMSLLVNREGGIQYANRSACDHLGYGREEMLALKYPSLDVGNPDFGALFDRAFHGAVPRFEAIFQNKAGARFRAECSVFGLGLDSESLVLLSVREMSGLAAA